VAQLLIVADDLTGAADAGACFAEAGLSTAIWLAAPAHPVADVLVVSSESRDAPEHEAVRRAHAAISAAAGAGLASWVYQKIDSALRGHPRAELVTTMAYTGVARALAAPALPSQGRTTVGGKQLVDGVPLTTTALGEPNGADDVVALFRGQDGEARVTLLDLATIRSDPLGLRRIMTGGRPGIFVADAECDADLRAVAGAAIASGIRLFAGSAGLARQLAEALPLNGNAAQFPSIVRDGGPVLTVAGSRHPATARQIGVAADRGIPIIRLDQPVIDHSEASIAQVAGGVATQLASGRHVVLTTDGLRLSAVDGRAVAAHLATIVALVTATVPVGGLVLTGGDMAAAVCAALGVEVLWVRGEVRPAIPWGVLAGGALAGTLVATKAGSFGEPDALVACIDHLARLATPRASADP